MQVARTVATAATDLTAGTAAVVVAIPAMVLTPSNGWVGHDYRDETVGCAATPSCKGGNVMANKAPKDAKDPNGAKAPGKPGAEEGCEDPKTGEKWVKGSDGRGGWEDSKGRVWQPTGPGSLAHGGAHWDRQNGDGTHTNVYPGGATR